MDAVLSGANLAGADFRGVDLTAADLGESDLTGTLLSGANLTRARMKGALKNNAVTDATTIRASGTPGPRWTRKLAHQRSRHRPGDDDEPGTGTGAEGNHVPRTAPATIEAQVDGP